VFFTKVAYGIAWLAFIPSAVGYLILMLAVWTDNIAAVAEVFGTRFLATSGSFAEGIAVGVAFGVAAEISFAIGERVRP
jgi:hypothetical protein